MIEEEKMVPQEKFTYDFTYLFEDEVSTLEEALDKLNFAASQIKYKYKKGPWSSKGNSMYFSLYCKCKLRNKKKFDEKENDSENELVESKKFPCEPFYIFKFNNLTNKFYLNTYVQEHNHQGEVEKNLTPQMMNEIQYFKKTRPVIDIVHYFEAKYRCSLDYHQVYHEFKKTKPIFGKNDCTNFYQYLQSKASFIGRNPIENDQSLTKLIFLTETMKRNYELYGDIIMMDSTYNTNLYRIPLVVLTGIRKDGKNVLFGLVLVNNETYETYKWILEHFFRANNNQYPRLIVTDGDTAMYKALSEYKEVPIIHLLCQWHVKRNMNRRFKFLKTNQIEDYNKILSLVKEMDPIKWEKTFQEIEEMLKLKSQPNNTYEKALKYLTEIKKEKEKWASAYRPLIFTGGVHTTSRAEAMNSLIKKYCSKTTEISALIDFIEDIEKNSSLVKKKIEKINDDDPLIKSLAGKLGEVIYNHHRKQFGESVHYTAKIIEEELEKTTYTVLRDNTTEEEIIREGRTVVWKPNEIDCSCKKYFVTGIICRHLFVVSKLRQNKDLSKFIHQRWRIDEVEGITDHSFTEEEKKAELQKDLKREKNEEMEEEKMLKISKILTKNGKPF